MDVVRFNEKGKTVQAYSQMIVFYHRLDDRPTRHKKFYGLSSVSIINVLRFFKFSSLRLKTKNVIFFERNLF